MTTIPPEGSDAEAKAIAKEFKDCPEKYNYDFGACQRGFRKMIRQKYQAEQAGSGIIRGSEDEARAVRLHYAENQNTPGHNYMDSVRHVRAEIVRYNAAEAAKRYSDTPTEILAGSEEEAAEITRYYEANKERLKGDYSAAQRQYRAENGIKYLPAQTVKYKAANPSPVHFQKYRDAISPEIVKQPNGKFTLKRIPIFECHDREDIHCDDRWMHACVADQKALKAKGYLPRLLIGHTSDDRNAPEKPAAAALDNYDFDPRDKWLYADYVDVPADLLAEIKANKWPGRSAEASRSRPALEVVALLGGTPPYFKLPDVRYSIADPKVYIYSECRMATRDPKSSLMRQIYAEMAGADAKDDSQYEKFCELMKRFFTKAFREDGGSERTTPARTPPAGTPHKHQAGMPQN